MSWVIWVWVSWVSGLGQLSELGLDSWVSCAWVRMSWVIWVWVSWYRVTVLEAIQQELGLEAVEEDV